MLRLAKYVSLIAVLYVSTCYAEGDMPQLRGASDSLPQKINPDECVVACYQRSGNDSIVVAGFYKTIGNYTERVCRPDGFMGDISPVSSSYSKRCMNLPNCQGKECWAGGDTGGYYGHN